MGDCLEWGIGELNNFRRAGILSPKDLRLARLQLWGGLRQPLLRMLSAEYGLHAICSPVGQGGVSPKEKMEETKLGG